MCRPWNRNKTAALSVNGRSPAFTPVDMHGLQNVAFQSGWTVQYSWCINGATENVQMTSRAKQEQTFVKMHCQAFTCLISERKCWRIDWSYVLSSFKGNTLTFFWKTSCISIWNYSQYCICCMYSCWWRWGCVATLPWHSDTQRIWEIVVIATVTACQ